MGTTTKIELGLMAMVCAAGSAVAAPDRADQPAGGAGTVEAVEIADYRAWEAPAGGEPVRARRVHPPIDQIPAMPIPHALEFPPAHADASPGAPVMYDLATGVETLLPTRRGSGLSESQAAGFNGADMAQSTDDYATRGFADMFEVDPSGFPWRMNCKLVMRFEDVNGIDRYYVASGTMADAETVLTAGHCVYAHSPNGVVIEDWAEDVWVYPGWDGSGSTNEFSGNFGEAVSTGLGSFTGWTVSGSFDWDMGLVRVSRAVGMLTGWYGWQWTTGCPTETYHNASYPAEGCGGGLHNGRDMYYWYGTWDSCPGNQLQLDTDGGCFDTVWGGMSGSGAYKIENDSRYVLGVCSNSNRSTVGRYSKMWESFKDYMLDFENGSRGSTFDLQALQARYSDATITAGQTVSAEVDIPNPTNANPASDTYFFRHYLSTNDFISSGDTQIGGTWQYTYNYGAVHNAHINPHSITIPYNTPSGNYYLGVLLDDANDSVSSNDNTEGWDSFPVYVTGVADLDAVFASAPSGTYNPGESLNVSFDVDNIGGDSSNSVTIDFRLSNNTTISEFDYPMGTRVYSGISGNGSLNTSSLRDIPLSIPAGTYYVGIIASATDDVDNANNWVSSIGTITIAECPADFAPPYGVLDYSDVFSFLSAFGSQSSEADLAAPFGVWDFSDVFAFLQSYGAGCP